MTTLAQRLEINTARYPDKAAFIFTSIQKCPLVFKDRAQAGH